MNQSEPFAIDDKTGASFAVTHVPSPAAGVVAEDCKHGYMEIKVAFPRPPAHLAGRIRSEAYALLSDLAKALVQYGDFRLLTPVAASKTAQIEKLPGATRLRQPDIGGFTYRDEASSLQDGAVGCLYVSVPEGNFPEVTKGDIGAQIQSFVTARNHAAPSSFIG